MIGRNSFWPLLGVALLAAHIGSAVALSRLIFWAYFDAGLKWTPDPVMPQIQSMLLLVGQPLFALIFVPVGLYARMHSRGGLWIAIMLPPAYAALPFLLPNIFGWLVAAIGLFVTGLVLARKKAASDGA